MSYTPFPMGAKSPTLDAMFSDRMRQIESRTRAALRMLSAARKQASKAGLFDSVYELFNVNGCLVGQPECKGFVPTREWSSFPLPTAEICECKKISEPLRQHFASYFLDALEQSDIGSAPLTRFTHPWVQSMQMDDGHSSVFQIVFFLMSRSSVLASHVGLSNAAQNLLALAFALHGPTHVLIDWSDFLSGFYKARNHAQPSASGLLDSIRPGLTAIVHLGDYRFRLKTASRGDVELFDRLITELDHRRCSLIVVGQQPLFESPGASLLDVDYRNDWRESFTDTRNKTRFTSTKRKSTENIALLDCMPLSTADRLLGLLADGQKVLHANT